MTENENFELWFLLKGNISVPSKLQNGINLTVFYNWVSK